MFRHAFLTLLLIVPSLAVASDKHAAGTYLSDAQVSAVMAALPAPSAPGSAEDKADYAATDRAFADRSAADFDQARREEKFNAFDFAPVIGKGFQADKLPHVAALFKEAEQETKDAVDRSKNHWKRPRPCPPASDCASNPEKAAKKSFGYPSGHSSRATVDAVLLTQLFPQDADALMQHARDIGWRRVVKGVHTLQDIYAGRQFGQALATDMLASPAMQHDLAAARDELRAAGLAPKTP
ncbi:phosphatase PAP2 family protein [Dyella telluris]|uniref:Acid phosphatase n=1 Tax=Dyella telluris TaxID=2763498 RepID=A0A7G8Q8I6_9GAMM|nr:phosphatase PAP2 family protein [Dyella telluris]QNK03094.1 phosphatase PAP2 family protein [Dyella telluris]